MLKYTDFAGVVFDVDGTLLDDCPPGETWGLHEQSRLLAAQAVGKRHGIVALQNFTPEQAKQAFLDAKVHLMHAAVWQMLVIANHLSSEDEMDLEHPMVREIADLKDELHEDILRTKGREVPGAVTFIRALAEGGLAGKLAISSSAYRRDIDVFLELVGLSEFFPDKHIISRERMAHPKPHADGFDRAFKTLGLPESARNRVVAFEDDPRGIASAKAAGLYTCGITTSFSHDQLIGLTVAPDLIADSYATFADHFGLQLN